MDATYAIIGLWFAFALTHMGLSSQRLRPILVAKLGEGPFLGIYSLIALATFVPLVWIYMENRHEGPELWSLSLSTPFLWGLYGVMGVAWVLIVAALVQPSPASLAAPQSGQVRAVHRLTRHPLFMGLGLFGGLHLIPNSFAADVAFFGGFPIFAVIGSMHQDRRKRATANDELRSWYSQTPFLPFSGRGTGRAILDLPRTALIVGILITIALRHLHGPIFG
jgi:uncharacterized membrane protein